MKMTHSTAFLDADATKSFLRNLGACQEGLEFAEGKTLQTVWDTCERPNWLMWLMVKQVDKPNWPSHKHIVLAACACAETVAHLDTTGLAEQCIKITRNWAVGKATIEEVQELAKAALYATYTAFYAALYAAYYASKAASYASKAANAATYAAFAASYADGVKANIDLCNIIRSMVAIPF